MCPICLARGTLIDTPAGPVAVERLRLGDPSGRSTADGRRVAGTVIALGSTAAPPDHEVVRLVLEDGRTVTASPGHPLADGRLLGDLRPGDAVDGSRIAVADSGAVRVDGDLRPGELGRDRARTSPAGSRSARRCCRGRRTVEA